MKISTEIASMARHVGEEKAIELCAKAGFDGWDFSMFRMGSADAPTHPLNSSRHLQFARQLRRIGEDNGIRCNQSHAPFPVRRPNIRERLEDAIECTAEAGGEICIIHPSNDLSPEENAEMYFSLLPFAKSCHVKIATENMWNWPKGSPTSTVAACSTSESFCAHLDAVHDDFLVACLDLGHADMEGSGSGAVNMIRALGSRLQALHIHDNDLLHDSHQLPFTMKMDFAAIVKALKEIGYTGWFTMEADAYLHNFEERNVPAGVQKLADTARRLALMFESL